MHSDDNGISSPVIIIKGPLLTWFSNTLAHLQPLTFSKSLESGLSGSGSLLLGLGSLPFLVQFHLLSRNNGSGKGMAIFVEYVIKSTAFFNYYIQSVKVPP